MKKIFMVCLLLQMFNLGCNGPAKLAEDRALNSFLNGKSWDETAEYCRQWVKEDPENPVPHAILNLTYTILNQYDATKFELKIAYGSNSDIKRMTDWSSALVNRNPKNARALLIKGIAFETARDNKTAEDSYIKAMMADPNLRQTYQSLGNYYMANRQLDKALVTYLALLKIDPNYAPVYGSIAMVYIMKRDINAAVKFSEKSVELDPNDTVGQYNLANAYIETGMKEKAKLVLQKIIELDPNGEIGRDSKNLLLSLSR